MRLIKALKIGIGLYCKIKIIQIVYSPINCVSKISKLIKNEKTKREA